jgi:hypothetical protein
MRREGLDSIIPYEEDETFKWLLITVVYQLMIMKMLLIC